MSYDDLSRFLDAAEGADREEMTEWWHRNASTDRRAQPYVRKNQAGGGEGKEDAANAPTDAHGCGAPVWDAETAAAWDRWAEDHMRRFVENDLGEVIAFVIAELRREFERKLMTQRLSIRDAARREVRELRAEIDALKKQIDGVRTTVIDRDKTTVVELPRSAWRRGGAA
jgi:hypothetical protein